MIQKLFGAEVRRQRLRLGWTQEELAARSGKHWTYIGGIERGERNPTLGVVDALAKALGLSVRDLFPTQKRSR